MKYRIYALIPAKSLLLTISTCGPALLTEADSAHS